MFAKQAQAEFYPYLVFTQLDNTEQSISVDGLKITFSDGNLCATQGSQTLTLPLTALSGMHFATSPTGIEAVSTQNATTKASIKGRQISVTTTEPASVTIYNAWGMQLAATTLSAGETRLVTDALPTGIYAVVINGKTQKLCVR